MTISMIVVELASRLEALTDTTADVAIEDGRGGGEKVEVTPKEDPVPPVDEDLLG